jgi:hypothetical protein
MRDFDLAQIKRNLRSCPYDAAAVRLNRTQKTKEVPPTLGSCFRNDVFSCGKKSTPSSLPYYLGSCLSHFPSGEILPNYAPATATSAALRSPAGPAARVLK